MGGADGSHEPKAGVSDQKSVSILVLSNLNNKLE